MIIVIDDDLWSAVGDPMRRRMLDQLLLDGGGTPTSLSEHLPVTRQAVSKHLDVLDRVGLVHGTAIGRERRYQVDDAQLARAVAQLASVGATWDARLRRIKQIAEAIEQSQETAAAPLPTTSQAPKPAHPNPAHPTPQEQGDDDA